MMVVPAPMRRLGAFAGLVTASLTLAACTLISGASELQSSTDDATPDASTSSGGSSGVASSSGMTSSGSSGSGGNPASEGGPPNPGQPDASGEPCTPKSYGPRFPTNVAGEFWRSPGLAKVDDMKVAHGDRGSGPIHAAKFRFTIPVTAQILGIEVKIARSSVGPVSDGSVSLAKGSPKAQPGNWVEDMKLSNFPKATYGGPADLWGAAWTPADINSPDGFGVSLIVAGNGDGHVDSFAATVFTCE